MSLFREWSLFHHVHLEHKGDSNPWWGFSVKVCGPCTEYGRRFLGARASMHAPTRPSPRLAACALLGKAAGQPQLRCQAEAHEPWELPLWETGWLGPAICDISVANRSFVSLSWNFFPCLLSVKAT